MHFLGRVPVVVNFQVVSGVYAGIYLMLLLLSLLLAKVLKYQILTVVFMKGSHGIQAVVCDGSSVSVWVQW